VSIHLNISFDHFLPKDVISSKTTNKKQEKKKQYVVKGNMCKKKERS
jgi:hypothetical protein